MHLSIVIKGTLLVIPFINVSKGKGGSTDVMCKQLRQWT